MSFFLSFFVFKKDALINILINVLVGSIAALEKWALVMWRVVAQIVLNLGSFPAKVHGCIQIVKKLVELVIQ
jgi:hypothetical protein